MKQVGIILGPVLILAFLGDVDYTCISLGLKMKISIIWSFKAWYLLDHKFEHCLYPGNESTSCLCWKSRKTCTKSLNELHIYLWHNCRKREIHKSKKSFETNLQSRLHIRIKAEILSFQLTKHRIWPKKPESWCKGLTVLTFILGKESKRLSFE